MAERGYLHHNHLESFKEWLVKDGWILLKVKGEYEVLRAVKNGRKRPLIIYTKIGAKEHYSFDSRDGGVINAFMKNYKEGKVNENLYIH